MPAKNPARILVNPIAKAEKVTVHPDQSHTQFEQISAPDAFTPDEGLPKELAAPAPCTPPVVPEVCTCATPGKPYDRAAPAFCSAPGSEPKKFAAPIPPAVPFVGGRPWL